MVLYATASFGAGPVKIGCIDLQKALNESDAGKEAKLTFNKRLDELQKVFDEKQSELKKLQEDIEKQKGLLTPEAKAEKEKVWQQKLKDVQRFTKDSQEELQQKDAELTKKILKDLKDTIKKIGVEEEYSIILEKSDAFVFYTTEGVDITEKAIKAYNKTRKQ